MSPISTFLYDDVPTQLRGLVWLSLSETGHIVTRGFASDSGGGGSATFTSGTAMPCRIDPVASRRAGDVTGGRIDERTTHVVTLPAGTAVVDSGKQFLIDGRGTFEVTAVRDRTGAWVREFEVVAV